MDILLYEMATLTCVFLTKHLSKFQWVDVCFEIRAPRTLATTSPPPHLCVFYISPQQAKDGEMLVADMYFMYGDNRRLGSYALE